MAFNTTQGIYLYFFNCTIIITLFPKFHLIYCFPYLCFCSKYCTFFQNLTQIISNKISLVRVTHNRRSTQSKSRSEFLRNHKKSIKALTSRISYKFQEIWLHYYTVAGLNIKNQNECEQNKIQITIKYFY